MCLGPLPLLWLEYQGFPGKLKESFMEVWCKSIRSIAVYISASPAHPFLACPVLPKLGLCLGRGTRFSFIFVLNTLGLAMLRPLYFFMHGDQPPIVWVHGLCCVSALWVVTEAGKDIWIQRLGAVLASCDS